MHSLGQEPSPYYIEETRTLYDEIASAAGLTFTLQKYDADGAAQFAFKK